MTWEMVSRVMTARLLMQLPKPQRKLELERLKLWRKYCCL